MRLNERQFDDQIRFWLTVEQKMRLYTEAKRQRVAAADLLRPYIDLLPGPVTARVDARWATVDLAQGLVKPARIFAVGRWPCSPHKPFACLAPSRAA